MSRKPSKSPANGTPEAADLSAADPKDGNADTSVAVATQDPQAAEDVNARECEFCAMVMPADSKDPACPMCFRDNRLYIMLRFLAAKGQTYCNAVHDGKRCEYVLNMRSDGKDVFAPWTRRIGRSLRPSEAPRRGTDNGSAGQLAEAKGFFNGGDDWKALRRPIRSSICRPNPSSRRGFPTWSRPNSARWHVLLTMRLSASSSTASTSAPASAS